MKNTTGIILGVILVIAVIWGVMYYSGQDETPSVDEQSQSGSLYVSVTDATLDINNISEIDMEIEKVEVYSEEKGWVTISDDSKIYPLLALKDSGKAKLHGWKDIDAGTYSRVRVTLGDTNVRTKAGSTIKVVIPSSQVVSNSTVVVNGNEKSHITLDFLADRSLHIAAGNKYIFTPVINSEARSNAQIAVASDEMVTVSGGKVDSQTKVGVDLQGSSRTNFELNTSGTSKLEVKSTSGNIITIDFNGKTYTSDSAKAREAVVTTDLDATGGGSLNVDGVLDTNLNTNINTNTNTNSGGSSTSGSGGLNLDLNY